VQRACQVSIKTKEPLRAALQFKLRGRSQAGSQRRHLGFRGRTAVLREFAIFGGCTALHPDSAAVLSGRSAAAARRRLGMRGRSGVARPRPAPAMSSEHSLKLAVVELAQLVVLLQVCAAASACLSFISAHAHAQQIQKCKLCFRGRRRTYGSRRLICSAPKLLPAFVWLSAAMVSGDSTIPSTRMYLSSKLLGCLRVTFTMPSSAAFTRMEVPSKDSTCPTRRTRRCTNWPSMSRFTKGALLLMSIMCSQAESASVSETWAAVDDTSLMRVHVQSARASNCSLEAQHAEHFAKFRGKGGKIRGTNDRSQCAAGRSCHSLQFALELRHRWDCSEACRRLRKAGFGRVASGQRDKEVDQLASAFRQMAGLNAGALSSSAFTGRVLQHAYHTSRQQTRAITKAELKVSTSCSEGVERLDTGRSLGYPLVHD